MRFLLEEETAHVRREYRLRLLAIGFVLTGVSALISTVLMLPSYFLTVSKEHIVQTRAEVLQGSASIKENEVFTALLIGAQEKLALFFDTDARAELSGIVAEVVLYKPSGISLTSITYEQMPKNIARMVIVGLADNRDVLLTFKQSLERGGLFESVDLPVSNLAKDHDINFSITVVGDF
jgi:hypothetical protein